MKKIVSAFVLLTVLSYSSCIEYPCDATIIYAMEKERNAIEDRVGDMLNTLRAISSQVEVKNALMAKDSIELLRLRQRYRIRLLDAKKQSYILNNTASIIDVGSSLQTIKCKASLNQKQH